MEEAKSAAQNLASDMEQKGAKTQWRPFLIGNRMRTTSEDSADSFDAFDLESPSSTTQRRFSITEKFFGSSMPGRERRVSATEYELNPSGTSITKNKDLKEFMKRQRKILGDDEWQ